MKNLIAMSLLLSLMACRSEPTASEALSNAAPPVVQPTWSGSMRALQSSLSTVEPLIFDTAQFTDPKNQNLLKSEIHKMAVESKNISHNPTLISRDPTVRFVTSQFSDDLQHVDENFTSGKKDYARYRLLKVTSYCVECHTRTQQGPEFNFGRVEPFLQKMSAADQVEFLIANRKFDWSLNLVEKAISSPRQNMPHSWDIERLVRQGLQVAVQFKQDPASADRIISAIQKNPDSPFFLQQNLPRWKASIDHWKTTPGPLKDIASARALSKDRKSEVDDMRVIASLLGLLSKDLKPDELGEALLLTGESYENLNDMSGMALNENYYESCIRQVPHTKWSKICFQKLESSTVLGYSGSSGTHIPLEMQIHLEALKREAD
jgi:hypothetical protein